MTLREDLAADRQAAWFAPDGLAQPVSYQPAAGGAAIPTMVIVQYGDNLGGQGRYLLEEMTAFVNAAEVALPQNGDEITLTETGAVWTVRKIKAGDVLGLGWHVGCTRAVRAAQRPA